ncbi:hypothetical protein QFZ78_003881 [Paenibacillus sp. V4I5]|nr:hypothetical protein [Paenibacillus sp. V4I5]
MMNHTTQNTNSDFRHLTYSHAPDYSEMHLHHKLWNRLPISCEAKLRENLPSGALTKSPSVWAYLL